MKPAIVVTGASSGIGRALALVAGKDAAAMLLIGQSKQNLDEVAAELAAIGVGADVLTVDLSDRNAGPRIEAALMERGLYCDILVNSAGFGLFGPACEISHDEQIKLLDVNARALADLSLRFLPGMLERNRGGILNVGSIAAYSPGPYMAIYFASKAFVKSFTFALAAEVAGTGVTITCLAPGVVRTPFLARCQIGQTPLFKIAPRSHAPAIAEAGWRGFKAGKREVIPRLVDRMIARFCSLMPERVLLVLIATLQRPRPDSTIAGASSADRPSTSSSGTPGAS